MVGMKIAISACVLPPPWRSLVSMNARMQDKKGADVSVSLDKKSYKELLVLLGLGAWVRERVAKADGRPLTEMDRVLDAAFEAARGTAAMDHVREREGMLVNSAWIDKEIKVVMDRFIDDEFWHELAVRLAQRDFIEDMTDEEAARLRAVGGTFSDRIDDLVDRWEDELDEHGVERLRVEE